jgi:hypothetical protein
MAADLGRWRTSASIMHGLYASTCGDVVIMHDLYAR